jgi:hypothetical protein
MCQPFIIIKPEGARFLKEIEDEIILCGYSIKKMYHVKDWESIGTKLYSFDWEYMNKLQLEFKASIWICKYLLNNEGILVLIKNDNNMNSEEIGYKVKRSFRNKYTQYGNETMFCAVNSGKIGIKYIVEQNISSSNKFKNIEKKMIKNGSWRRIKFSHIHSPDSTVESLKREWNHILTEEIISSKNLISKENWSLMKKAKCIILPSILKNKKKAEL